MGNGQGGNCFEHIFLYCATVCEKINYLHGTAPLLHNAYNILDFILRII